jgi:hypothetical protein
MADRADACVANAKSAAFLNIETCTGNFMTYFLSSDGPTYVNGECWNHLRIRYIPAILLIDSISTRPPIEEKTMSRAADNDFTRKRCVPLP